MRRDAYGEAATTSNEVASGRHGIYRNPRYAGVLLCWRRESGKKLKSCEWFQSLFWFKSLDFVREMIENATISF